jgi:hypothetical protein
MRGAFMAAGCLELLGQNAVSFVSVRVLPVTPPVLNDYSRGVFRLACGVTISFASGHDRALHQHMPYLRKFLGLREVRFLSQAMDDSANSRKMNGGRFANRAVGFRLQ